MENLPHFIGSSRKKRSPMFILLVVLLVFLIAAFLFIRRGSLFSRLGGSSGGESGSRVPLVQPKASYCAIGGTSPESDHYLAGGYLKSFVGSRLVISCQSSSGKEEVNTIVTDQTTFTIFTSDKQKILTSFRESTSDASKKENTFKQESKEEFLNSVDSSIGKEIQVGGKFANGVIQATTIVIFD